MKMQKVEANLKYNIAMTSILLVIFTITDKLLY